MVYMIRFSSIRSVMDFYRKARNQNVSFSLYDRNGTGRRVTEHDFEQIVNLDWHDPLELTILSGDAAAILE